MAVSKLDAARVSHATNKTSKTPKSVSSPAVEKPTAVVMSIKDFIAKTGLSRSSVYRYVDSGEIKTVSIGGRRLITMKEFDRLFG